MKLHIAAVESCMSNREVLAELQNYDNYLLSYYYLSKLSKKENISSFLEKLSGKNIIIDSGAHTFHNQKAQADYKVYVENYINYLINNPYWSNYVELDIDNIIGLKNVEKIRKKLESEVTIPPIPVWHKERGWDYWEKMCENYQYVGFSGFTAGNQKESEVSEKMIPKFLQVAKDNKAKVHGFGLTRCNLLKKYHFDSVDSSSWTYASKMNEKFVFNGRKIQYLGKFIKKPENPHHYGLVQWMKYAIYIEKWWKNTLTLYNTTEKIPILNEGKTMKEQKSKPTEKERMIEKNVRKILGDDEFENQMEKFKKIYPYASEAGLIREIQHRLDEICPCRIELDKIPENEREALRNEVRTYNKEHNTNFSVMGYLKEIKGKA